MFGFDKARGSVHVGSVVFGKKNFSSKLSSVAAVIFALSSLHAANAEVIFDNTPAPLPNNVPSWGFQANQTSEFGNEITFAGTSRSLTNVEIIMSDWANQTDYPGVGDANGYDQPLTLNFYNPGSGTSVGSLIATRTETVHVPWNTNPGSGTAFPVNFDFTGATVPDTVVFGVAYNTETYGANPTGMSGPYISLNYGFAVVAPSVGTDVNPDDEYWNTSTASNYTDGGTAGVGIFREDTGWTGDVATIQVTAVPEPASIALLALGLTGLLLFACRRVPGVEYRRAPSYAATESAICNQ